MARRKKEHQTGTVILLFMLGFFSLLWMLDYGRQNLSYTDMLLFMGTGLGFVLGGVIVGGIIKLLNMRGQN